MKVLIVGAGGREHALAWKLQREGVDVVVAPGNGGIHPAVPIAVTDFARLAALARSERVALTLVGPEVPLAAGIVDTFDAAGLKIFGPTRAAARLESSKAWAKELFVRHGIPTGRAEVVTNAAAARRAIARTGLPVAIKADGLAAGKGVTVAMTPSDVDSTLDSLFEARALGAASDHVLIEEYLAGRELSLLAFTDGERLAVMPPARDYKRVGDGDTGPNTGGMGAVTRPADVSAALVEQIERTILRPTIDGLAAAGVPYRGVLYAGLMLTTDGPKVIEFNCRFGDPECQVLVPLLDSRLLDVVDSVVEGRLETPRWRDGHTYGVVLAAPGYPEAPRLGQPIAGLEDVPEDVQVFHAGTAIRHDELVTAGGRVLTIVSGSRARAYAAADVVRFAGKHFRRDIGAADDTNAGTPELQALTSGRAARQTSPSAWPSEANGASA